MGVPAILPPLLTAFSNALLLSASPPLSGSQSLILFDPASWTSKFGFGSRWSGVRGERPFDTDDSHNVVAYRSPCPARRTISGTFMSARGRPESPRSHWARYSACCCSSLPTCPPSPVFVEVCESRASRNMPKGTSSRSNLTSPSLSFSCCSPPPVVLVLVLVLVPVPVPACQWRRRLRMQEVCSTDTSLPSCARAQR